MFSSLAQKIIFITGASSGIGEACAKHFAAVGCRLIITARRLEKILALAEELKHQYNSHVLAIQLDVRDNERVKTVIHSLPAEWQAIDVLVNNAGLALSSDLLHEGNIDNWDTMIDTNIKGLLYVSRAILPGMIVRNSGHIINIGSIAGHDYYPRGNVYVATKHAVRAINHAMRLDLAGTPLRITEIAPGAVDTEFSEVRWQDKHRADEFYQTFAPLHADDIADAVLYAASRPPHVNIAEMVVMPTVQASCNHLQKKL
jgi:NADP-dependent 3-hydroxy acid dehydrogenase YdfG